MTEPITYEMAYVISLVCGVILTCILYYLSIKENRIENLKK